MESVRFQIFQASQDKKKISTNLMLCTAWIFTLLFLCIADQYFTQNNSLNEFKYFYLLISGLTSVCWIIIGFWIYKPLNGELKGYIEFNSGSFTIDEETFYLDDIRRFDMYGDDYYGRQTRQTALEFSPGLSQGVSNFFEFTDASNCMRKIYFKQTIKDQYRGLTSFFIAGIQTGKISFLRGIELLGLTDYYEIQEFKKKYNSNSQIPKV